MKFYQGLHHRIVELDRLIRDGRYPNCTRFAQKWECTRKTVQRDVTYLKDSLGAPIEYDYFRKGYFYTDPAWKLPGLDLTEGELFLLLVAERMAEQYKGTPLAANLEGLFTKIRAALPDKVTIDPAYFRTQLVSFHGHPVREISQNVWMHVFKALRTNKVIRIFYVRAGSSVTEEREVEPLHLACIDSEWYLIAYCRLRKNIRHFAISRTTRVKQDRKTFQPREFNAKEYFANRFSRFIGEPGKIYNIVIRFSKDAAQWVSERTWHPKQRIETHRDGSLTLSFPAPALYEVKRWVFQWGADAEVLAPAALRESVKREVKMLSHKY
jgi:proteasome accessory factor B